MTIKDQDIQILESLVMDDVADGGRGPSGREVQYGKSNGIFNDVTEVDRAGGNVSIRQLHMAVRTPNTDQLMQGSIILSMLPTDPNASITLAKCSLFAKRSDIAQSIANYLIQGTQWGAVLLEDHVAGQKSIQLFHRKNTPVPDINRTLVLSYLAGTSNERIQYVRVTRTETTEATYTYNTSGSFVDYQGLKTKVDISAPLLFNFPGSPPTRDFVTATNKTIIRDTTVADAAEYFGSSTLTSAATLGDTEIRVKTIYSQIVPNSRTETTAVDQRPAAVRSIRLAESPRQVDVAVAAHTRRLRINQSNRGFSFVDMLRPLPEPGSVIISYRALGVWYTLSDDGTGVLAGAGAGRVIHTTGSVEYTLQALPDDSSSIIIQWAERVGYTNRSTQTSQVRAPEYVFVLERDGYARGTLVVRWTSAGVLRTATAGVNGKFTGDASGEIDAPSGTVYLRPKFMIDAGGQFDLQYQRTTEQLEILPAAGVDAGGFALLTLAQVPAAGSLAISWATVQEISASSGGTLTNSSSYKGETSRQSVLRQPVQKAAPVWEGVGVSGMRSGGSSGGPGVSTGYYGSPGVEYENVVVNTMSGNNNSASWTRETHQTEVQKLLTLNTVTDDGEGSFLTGMGTVDYTARQVNLRMVIGGHKTQGYKSDYENSAGFETSNGDTSTSSNTTIKGGEYGDISFGESVLASSSVVARYRVGTTTPENVTQTFTPPAFTIDLCPYTQDRIVPGSLRFSLMATVYEDFEGVLYRERTSTSPGIVAGNVDYAAGIATMSDYVVSGQPTDFSLSSLWTQRAAWNTASIFFRTQAAPIKPTGITLLTLDLAGNAITASGDGNGAFTGTNLRGRFDYESGVGELQFGAFVLDSALTPEEKAEWWYDANDVGTVEAGKIWRPRPVDPTSLRYNAVAYFYLPLDAEVIGLDPVRLPPDGRVPIYRAGGYLVLVHTGVIPAATLTNGQTINCSRTRLARVYLVGSDGKLISNGYVVDLDAGLVHVEDTAGWAQPVTIKHRIEEMTRIAGVQIDGRLGLTSPLSHEFPIGTVVASAIMTGNLKARVKPVFDQQNWSDGVWRDAAEGAVASATFNDGAYPIAVTNAGTFTERFALRVLDATDVEVIGEHVGNLGRFSRNTTIAPRNPTSDTPYFSIPPEGWGSGWAAGNVMFTHTVGTYFPFAIIRAVQPGAAPSNTDFAFEIEPRGDVDRLPTSLIF